LILYLLTQLLTFLLIQPIVLFDWHHILEIFLVTSIDPTEKRTGGIDAAKVSFQILANTISPIQ